MLNKVAEGEVLPIDHKDQETSTDCSGHFRRNNFQVNHSNTDIYKDYYSSLRRKKHPSRVNRRITSMDSMTTGKCRIDRIDLHCQRDKIVDYKEESVVHLVDNNRRLVEMKTTTKYFE